MAPNLILLGMLLTKEEEKNGGVLEILQQQHEKNNCSEGGNPVHPTNGRVQETTENLGQYILT